MENVLYFMYENIYLVNDKITIYFPFGYIYRILNEKIM